MEENKEKFYVTEEGLKDLQNELDNYIHVVKVENIEDLKAARAQGDLSENADYDAAREKQAEIEARIKELEYMIRNAEIISGKRSNKYVRLGSTVKLEEMDTHNTLEYTIVGSVEADPLNGRLSNVTPLAIAILDQKVGSIVTVKVDEPYEVKILSVK